MKKLFVLLFFVVIISTNIFAQVSMGQAATNTALIISRWSDWETRCNNIWNSRFKNSNFIGPGTYNDYIYQQGAFAGIAMAVSETIDQFISNIRMLQPEERKWLTADNSNIFFKKSQKTSWYDNLTTEQRKIYNSGYWVGYFWFTGESTILPDICEWKLKN